MAAALLDGAGFCYLVGSKPMYEQDRVVIFIRSERDSPYARQ